MKKRLFCSILALCMVLCLVPMQVLAEDTTHTNGADANEVAVSVKTADDLKTAIEDANKRKDETTVITLRSSLTVTSRLLGTAGIDIWSKIVLDLNGFKLTVQQTNNHKYAFYLNGGSSFTIRDSSSRERGTLLFEGAGKEKSYQGFVTESELILESGTVEGANMDANKLPYVSTNGGFVNLSSVIPAVGLYDEGRHDQRVCRFLRRRGLRQQGSV